MSSKGKVFIVSAPSGSGKSTIVNQLLQAMPEVVFSVSFTTRKPRGTERNGVEYHFVSEEEFERMIAEDQLIEFARVFGDYYGTGRRFVEQARAAGKDVILDIDTEGATQVKRKIKDAVSIFIMPPSHTALLERLQKRGLDRAETIQKRLNWAVQKEIHRCWDYDYVVINEDLEASVKSMKGIVLAERCRKERQSERLESIIKTFGGI
jgi:guanylate kinase